MTYNYAQRLKTARNLLEKADIAEDDRENIERFVSHVEAMGVSAGYRAKYMFQLKTCATIIHLTGASRGDIERLVNELRKRGYAPVTLLDYMSAIKRFVKFLKYGNVDADTPFPDEVKWLKVSIKANQRRQPEFLTPHEVETMITTTTNVRNKAMLAVGFEAGLRASELLNMNVGDVFFDKIGARIKVRGKTGERVVRLISSVPLLTRWLEERPGGSNPSDPLWTSMASNKMGKRLNYFSWNMIIKEIARAAGIKKRVHNHMLRHGSATEAAKYLTEEELKIRYGWSGGSDMPSVYVHLNSADLDKKLAFLYSGKEVKQPEPEFRPTICPRCRETNSPGQRFCGRCGAPLDPKEQAKSSVEYEEMKRKVDMILELLSRGQISTRSRASKPRRNPSS
ncbi:MAG: tyrosine-type recombinase/integrase [Candidatus Micrarchaeaceae archaeon]